MICGLDAVSLQIVAYFETRDRRYKGSKLRPHLILRD